MGEPDATGPIQIAAARDGSVVIQIQGDRNVVLAGGKPLLAYDTPAVRRKHAERAMAGSDLRLLRPDIGTTAYIRPSVFGDFMGWAKGKPVNGLSIRMVTGPAGAGKTRFALELLAALEANKLNAEGKLDPGGWVGGFVDLEVVARFDLKGGLTQLAWPTPTLLVVDYAEMGGDLLRAWLNYLAKGLAEGSAPVRILLLARAADPETGWAAGLLRYSSDGMPGLLPYFSSPAPCDLPPLGTPVDRRQVLQATLDAFAELRQDKLPPLPAPGEEPWFDKLLAGPQWGQPLCLMMAAAVACRSESATPVVDALSLSRTDLATDLAEREKTRLRRDAETRERGHLRIYLAACATLARGLSEDEAARIGDVVIEQSRIPFPGGGNGLAHDLHRCLSAQPGGIAPVEPDIIGEAFIYLAFRGQRDADLPLTRAQIAAILTALLERVQREDGGEVRLLMHLIQDFAGTWEELLDWLDDLVAQCGEERFGLLLRIADGLPEQTVVLRERAAGIYRTILDRLQALTAPADAEAHQSQVATALNNLAVKLGDLGRPEEALEKAQEAVKIYRALAEQRPDAFLPDLAMSLSNLANMLSDLGRREEALDKAQEAVTIYRALADQRPDAFLPDLAGSLNNLANMLSELGRREEALGTAEEAVNIYRALAEQRPDAFLPYLGASLNNLANMLSDLGRREEALDKAQEAVKIRRALAEQRPDAFLPYLARSLGTLHVCYKGLAQYAEARAAVAEAISLLTPLFAKIPQAHGRLMAALAQAYIEISREAGQEADETLLAPVVRVFEELRRQEGQGQDKTQA